MHFLELDLIVFIQLYPFLVYKLLSTNKYVLKFIYSEKATKFCEISTLSTYVLCKAQLLLLKLIHLFAREVLLVKKLEIEETKTT